MTTYVEVAQGLVTAGYLSDADAVADALGRGGCLGSAPDGQERTAI